MFAKKLAVVAVLAAISLVAAVADAVVTPDPDWGSNGTTTIAAQCTGGNRYHYVEAAYGGRFYDLQACNHDYYRLVRLGPDGKLETAYGVHGHVTLRVPSRCNASFATLTPAADGSVFLAFNGASGNSVTGELDQYVCLARITAAGKQVPNFGGATPYRRLDRIGHANPTTLSTAVDRAGRLLVFTENGGYNLKKSTVFVNRYLVSGQPDLTFSRDGQRAYTEAHQRRFLWGGVVGNNPVVAVASSNNDRTDGSGSGSAVVRFTVVGDRDHTFGTNGRSFVRNVETGGAQATRFTVDGFGRIVFVVAFGDRWFDLQRLSKSGVRDTAFGAATTRIAGASGARVHPGLLTAIHNHYLVSWTGRYGDRLTGFGFTGGRWSTVGTTGTTAAKVIEFAPDEAAAYDSPNVGEFGPVRLEVTRSLVQ